MAVKSLRKKNMGVQSLPRRQSMHPGMSDNASQPLPPPPRVRPRDKSKVESLMKRRYSTRGPLPSQSSIEAFPPELTAKSKTIEQEVNGRVWHTRLSFI